MDYDYSYPIPNLTRQRWLNLANQNQNKRIVNCGLVFDKYVPDWIGNPLQKAEGLKLVADMYSPPADLINAMNERMVRLIKVTGGIHFYMKTAWRLVAGFGDKGPLEVGFSFDRFGIPYIPGSSLKGLTRAYARQVIWQKIGDATLTVSELDDLLLESDSSVFSRQWEDAFVDCHDQNTIKYAHIFRLLFGHQGQAGLAVFYDAFPAHNNKILQMDILNPHYSSYYTGGENDPPKDSLNPKPVSFLTIAPGTQFHFAISLRSKPATPPIDQKAPIELRQARQWLKMALIYYGAGAKTSSGYGFFFP